MTARAPITIDAMRILTHYWPGHCYFLGVTALDGERIPGYIDIAGKAIYPYGDPEGGMVLLIPTLDGVMVTRLAEWRIRGVEGKIYPCKSDAIDQIYKLAIDFLRGNSDTAKGAADG